MMKITHETPTDVTSYLYDVGRYALRGFVRYMTLESENVPGASVEEPLESTDWTITDFSDEAAESFVAVLRNLEQERRAA